MNAGRKTYRRKSYAGNRTGTGRPSFRARTGHHSRPDEFHPQQGVIDWICDVAKIVIVAVVLLYVVSFAGKAYEIGYSIFYEEAIDEEGEGVEIEVTITEDMTVAQIGTMLEEAGLLQDGSVFRYQELFSSSHGQITAGTYTLSTEMTPSDIISALAENYEETSEDSSETQTDASDE